MMREPTVSTLPRLAALLFVAAIASASAQHFTIDPANAKLTFRVTHLAIAAKTGRFARFSGKWRLNPESNRLEHLEGVVKSASIDTKQSFRDRVLRGKKFFDADEYPEIRLKTLAPAVDGKILAQLTIKGITRNIELTITRRQSSANNSTDPPVFVLSGRLLRKDFHVGMGYPNMLISNSVQLDLQLEGKPATPKS